MKKKLKWRLAQELEYKWWQQYLHKKDTFEYLQQKKNYWLQLLSSLQEPVLEAPGQSILDAGCGPAGIFIALQDHQVVALDPLLERYKNLPHFNPDAYPWTTFIESPLELLADKEQYDTIFCMNAINHVNDITLCCRRLFDALKPGGHLVLSTDAHRFSLLKKIFQWLPGDMLHPVQLDINEYRKHLTDLNLEIKKSIRYKEAGIFNYYILIAQKTK
jgi:2-polyprenyl-3-methyl-5-hydroxy-6-metoxy-1,4-benzoquinol methylase